MIDRNKEFTDEDKRMLEKFELERKNIEFQELLNAKYSSYIQNDLCKITALSFLLALIKTDENFKLYNLFLVIFSSICILSTVYNFHLNTEWINAKLDGRKEIFLNKVMKLFDLTSNISFTISVIMLIIIKFIK